ncbi:hypothetical protein P3X46_012545 [Hevea brasiliensis]|uniref:FBD domain-containing protein n=1 Tax=Hevea brasiliensis TaxID=3981 RepID=A0ABQ9MAY0_HEVBR|nr:hypothetical protein P3X46_012545 [Hevea brasiliensis]
MALKRLGDTRWSSHYGTLINLIHLFPSVIDVLKYIGENGNIVNAMNLVKVSKCRLQVIRENGWESLLLEVLKFCDKYDIVVLDVENVYVARGRSRRRSEEMTNLHHYRVEFFYSVIDMQFQELNNWFDEVNTNWLLCMACLDPKDSFSAFDTSKLIQLAKFYPCEFSLVALIKLEYQLENFVFDMRMDKKFSEVSGIGGLAEKMVATKKHIIFPLVYLLIKLSLIL